MRTVAETEKLYLALKGIFYEVAIEDHDRARAVLQQNGVDRLNKANYDQLIAIGKEIGYFRGHQFLAEPYSHDSELAKLIDSATEALRAVSLKMAEKQITPAMRLEDWQ